MHTHATLCPRHVNGIGQLLIGALFLGTQISAHAFGTQDDQTRNAITIEFEQLDSNHDGWLSQAEARRDDDVATKFSSADTDHDRRLDLQEYTGFKSAVQRARMEAFLQDSSITAQIKTELVKDSGIKGLAISVETLHGTVLLSGFVDSAEQIRRAAEIASGIRGVRSIKNNLQLKG